MGLMVTVGIVSVRSGQGAAKVKAATRDVFAVIRHARSSALVTQQPAIITYSTERAGEEVMAKEVMAKIVITGADLISAKRSTGAVTTLSGATVNLGGGDDDGAGGESLEDILFAPISEDLVKGMRIKVEMGGDEIEENNVSEEAAKSKVSVFSNVDYLLGRFNDAKEKEKKKAEEEKEKEDGKEDAEEDGPESLEAPVSVVWEVNGRTEPHRVWVYADGSEPEKGLCIKIDRFGGAKVVGSDGEDD